jgi:protein O-mannosyl-transferase
MNRSQQPTYQKRRKQHGPIPASKKTASAQKASPLKTVIPLPRNWEALVIVVLSILLYVNTLGHGFALDDTMMITHNAFTKEGVAGIGKILTSDAFTGFHGEDKNLLPGGRYRPLSQIMFAVEYELFGMNPLPGHLINVLLYALACLLLWRVLHLLFAGHNLQLWRLSFPFVVALLFTTHPLHTEGVANIKGRDEILSLVGFAILAISALRYAATKENKWLYGMVPIFLLSMLAKESALTYLAAIPLLVLFKQGKPDRGVGMVFITLGIGVLAYSALRIAAIGIPPGGATVHELLNDPYLHATGTERFATVIYTWIKYIGLILFPHPLTHDYYPWHITYKALTNGWVIVSLVFFGGMALYALRKIASPNIVALGFMLFTILFSSQSNLLVNIGAFMNERFVFLAMLGILLMVAWVLMKWLPDRIPGGRGLALALLTVMVIGFSLRTVTRNSAWKDDYTLFTTDVEVSINSAKVNVSAGGKMVERALELENITQRNQLISAAIPYLKRGVALHPEYVQGHLVLGNALFHADDFSGAAAAYRDALKVRPGYRDAIDNLALVAARLRQLDDHNGTVEIFRTLLKYSPKDVEFATGLAEALLHNNELLAGERVLDSLIAVHPDHAQVNHLLGQLWGRYKAFAPGVTSQQHSEYMNRARSYISHATALDPGNYSMKENLGIVYGILGDAKRALEHFDEALRLLSQQEKDLTEGSEAMVPYHKDMARIHRNIADTHRNRNALRDALDHYRIANTLEPDDPMIANMVAELEGVLNRNNH